MTIDLRNEARTLAENEALTDGDLRQLAGHGSRAAEIALEMREQERARPSVARAVWS